MAKKKIHPQWVFLGNAPEVIRHVSEFDGINPRPKVICPSCREPVRLALGKKNTHHYRHLPDSECKLSHSRESIMHSNLKHHFASELNKTNKLELLITCHSNVSNKCHETITHLLFDDWQQALVEKGIGKYVADVAVLTNDVVSGVLEIFVTHELEEEKEKFLSEKVPWIELNVDDENYELLINWKAGEPLSIGRYCEHSMSIKTDFNCEPCAKKLEIDLRKELARQRQYEEFEARKLEYEKFPKKLMLKAIRELDLLFFSGKTYRLYLECFYDIRNNVIFRNFIKIRGEDDSNISEQFFPNDQNHIKNYNRIVVKRIHEYIGSEICYRKGATKFILHESRRPQDKEPPWPTKSDFSKTPRVFE